MAPLDIPSFATEAEEADWLYEHREEITAYLVAEVGAGRNGIGSRGRWKLMQDQKAREQAEAAATGVSVIR